LRHEPRAGDAAGDIAGHLHPVARVVTMRGSLRRRCFASDGARCVMPAFGAYAGGLNLRDAAFARLFPGRAPRAHVLGRDRVYAVAHEYCYAD
jgi:metallophosphoesterase superfamily enzyme